MGRAVALGLRRPPTAGEFDALAESVPEERIALDLVCPFDPARKRLLALGVVGALSLVGVLLVAGITSALAATESDEAVRLMVAIGAAPRRRALMVSRPASALRGWRSAGSCSSFPSSSGP
ncbi:MAG: hypothetical protein ACR2MA_11625 [Egibacteraceae bacterium]